MPSRIGIACLMCFCLAPVSAGEFGVRPGAVELSAMGGLNIGPSRVGNHPATGGDFQVYLARWVSIGLAGAWAPVMNSSYGSGVNANVNLYTYGTGVQLHMPNSSRLTPYASIGAGGMRLAGKMTQGGLEYFSAADSAFVGTFGGGTRVAIGKRWGVRMEAVAFKGNRTKLFGRVLVGVYGQFGGR